MTKQKSFKGLSTQAKKQNKTGVKCTFPYQYLNPAFRLWKCLTSKVYQGHSQPRPKVVDWKINDLEELTEKKHSVKESSLHSL